MRNLLRVFFRLLYHPFAFAYDVIAATVSFGRWKDWIIEVVPFIVGTRVLEVGHGPGHLQRILLSRGLTAVGIDESSQMGCLARRQIGEERFRSAKKARSQASETQQLAYTHGNIVRGLAQGLPFSNSTFDTVVSTFPAEYIFDPATLTEAHRVLTETGRFVILPGAIITGRGLWDRLMAWLFRITGQTPPNLSEIIHERTKEPFAKAGFQVEVHELDVRSSIVFVMVATKL
ncbi:MAG: methyltransferase domain-containing protein [Chloroflexi bacterium]|nr:methyltransferase domain-containing protein [Chloroflexota bacterium]